MGHKKGQIPWNLGKKMGEHTKEHNIKIGEGVKKTFEEFPEIKEKMKERIKEKAGNWKGGIIRFPSIAMKRRVFERDNYECQDCGLKIDLDCHHLDPKGLTVDENLVSLCPNCHRLRHRKVA